MLDPRAEAFDRVQGRFEVRVLEPAPPAIKDEPWLADDPAVRGEVPAGRRLVGPTSSADITWHELSEGDEDMSGWCGERWLGAWKRLDAPPPSFDVTRGSLHVLAEHVLAAARHRSNGKIGLRYTCMGFGTPFFGDDEQVRVAGTTIVHQQGHRETRWDITTPAAAARAIGITCGAPDEVYPPTTALARDEGLDIDAEGSLYLSDMFGFATSVLEELRARSAPEEHPSRVQLWPEHFDVALELGDESAGLRAGYGLSPGDENHDEPYLYVVPWGDCPTDPWWNATYFDGARCGLADLLRVSDQRSAALAFFGESRERLRSR